MLFGRHRSCTKLPWSASVRRLDDVCYRCRSPRSSKLHSHHWDRRFCVGPRFECLQTKRCALLWYVRYPCSIFHHLWSRLFNASIACARVEVHSKLFPVDSPVPSSSAPAFRLLFHSRGCFGSVRVTSANSQLSQFLPVVCIVRFSLFGLPVGSGQF